MDRDLSQTVLCGPNTYLASNCSTFNDETSSIANFTGGPVAVYSNAEFQGRCQTITNNVRNLAGSKVGNDSISSLQVGHRCP